MIDKEAFDPQVEWSAPASIDQPLSQLAVTVQSLHSTAIDEGVELQIVLKMRKKS